MPYSMNENVKIHYEVEGKGTPLVLHHGLMGSMEDWYEYGYVDALKDTYRLILIDGRGHGKSDKPHDPDLYSLYLRALDIVKVLDALEIDKSNYYGFSMGGMIAYGLMKWFPERFCSYIITGSHPYESSPDALKEMISTMDTWVPQEFKSKATQTRYLDNNMAALLASVDKKHEDQSETLKNNVLPCLMMIGKNDGSYDKVRTASKLSGYIELVELPGLNHGDSLFRSELVLPDIKRFLGKIPPLLDSTLLGALPK